MAINLPHCNRDDYEDTGTNGPTRYWHTTYYPDIDKAIVTAWWADSADDPIRDPLVYTSVHGSSIGQRPLCRIAYDPTCITVGGLAEAHEAICAKVEHGEIV